MTSTTPTMNDVAREARVGLKTVSRYVNGQTNIDPVLAGRIGDAIVALGYRRNLAAASIRPGWTSRVLGLIISDLANPYYSVLTRSIETYAREKGYLLISASSNTVQLRSDGVVLGYASFWVEEAGFGSPVIGFGVGGLADTSVPCGCR